MFKKGEVVYHDDLIFSDGVKDSKKERPCIVLFELDIDGERSVLTCPVTSNVNALNRYPDNYLLVPITLYHYHKLSFVRTNDFIIKPLYETHSTGIFVPTNFVDKVIEKIKNFRTKEYEMLKDYIIKSEKSLVSKAR